MARHLLKIIAFTTVCTLSFSLSSEYINAIVYEMEQKEKTIADIIIQQQIAESLKEAEEKIEQVKEEENLVIEEEEVAIKPAEEPTVSIQPSPEEEVEIEETTDNVVAESEEDSQITETEKPPHQDIELGMTAEDLVGYQSLSKEDITYVGRLFDRPLFSIWRRLLSK